MGYDTNAASKLEKQENRCVIHKIIVIAYEFYKQTDKNI